MVPGIDYTRYWIEVMSNRWDVEIREYQHWALSWYLRGGIFRPVAALGHR
jgi:hypothetical protein